MVFTHPMIKSNDKLPYNVDLDTDHIYLDLAGATIGTKRSDSYQFNLQGWRKVGKNEFVPTDIMKIGLMKIDTFKKLYGKMPINEFLDNFEQLVIDNIEYLHLREWKDGQHKTIYWNKKGSDFSIHRADQ